MMHIIPITPATLDILEKMNDGVRPELEIHEETFYVYRGEAETAKIITRSELEQSPEYPEFMTTTEILYINE